MKKNHLLLTFVFLLAGNIAFAWGVYGHKHINRGAIFALPSEMRNLYFNHRDFITEASVVPDLRRPLLNDRDEGPRHYVDVELFDGGNASNLPKTREEAYQRYDSAFLNQTGYAPWHIQYLMEKLTEAFRKRNKQEILFLSAEIGHYVADLHMPLHTSKNHDGQLTGQQGIHSLWESVLPPMFGKSYNYRVDDARLIADVPAHTANIVKRSHGLVPGLLAADMRVRNTLSPEDQFKKDEAGNLLKRYNKPQYSNEYARKLHLALNGMVEKQLRQSIQEVANYWFTAWDKAGKPNLSGMDSRDITRENRQAFRKQVRAWKKGRLSGI